MSLAKGFLHRRYGPSTTGGRALRPTALGCALLLSTLATALAGSAAVAAEPIPLERSVVRIVNYAQRGDWYTPWDMTQVAASAGSGFVIAGGLIMTNAHVVSDSRLLLIQPQNDPETHVAEVVHVAHDCDLALIRPVEEGILDGITALQFGEPPVLGSIVNTLGFPAGGLQISSTRGVVSRIEAQLYVHSGIDGHLTAQTDAAINPGSSGGPVIQDGKVVGVAFQANADLENTGFFIPLEVVRRLLRDVEDGRYDGYPELGANTVSLENPAAASHAGLAEGETGVRVDWIMAGSSAEGLLQEGDVLLAVNGRLVANDGSVEEGTTRIRFGMLVDRVQVGDSVSVRVLRDGKRFDIDVPLWNLGSYVSRGHRYDTLPRYYVYAGLVFVVLDLETLKTYGDNWVHDADRSLLHEYFIRPAFEPELLLQERVVFLRRLSHPVNADMAWFRNQAVERVNGREITSLEVLADTLENHDGEFQVLEFSGYRRLGVLDRRQAEAAHQEILQRYGIREDRRF